MCKKRNVGFSLVEIVMVLSVFALLLGAMFMVLTTGRSSWQSVETRIELQQDLRKAMVWISEELRQSGSSVISDVPADGSPKTTITFKIPSGVSAGEITWGSSPIQYLLGGINNQQLLRKVGSEQRVLANNITTFQIRRHWANPAIVEIALTAQQSDFLDKVVELSLDFQIKLRN